MKGKLSNCCCKLKSAHINFRVTQIRVVFLHPYPFVNFSVLSKEFPIRNCLPFFFQTKGNFYQIILSRTQGRGPNNSLIKKNQMPSEIKLLAGAKVYYSFQREIISM